jgi:glycosylphosphatidylinositol transamidase (GPIT) subunit GPI8
MYFFRFDPGLIKSGLVAVSSSGVDENSYSYHVDNELGVSIVDRFTFFTAKWMSKLKRNSKKILTEFVSYFSYEILHSNVNIRTDLWDNKNRTQESSSIFITDFFIPPADYQFAVVFERSKVSFFEEDDSNFVFEGFKNNVLDDIYHNF